MVLKLPLTEVGDEAQVPRAFNELGDLALVLGAQPALNTVHNLASGSDEAAEEAQIIVVEQITGNGLRFLPVDLARGVKVGGHEIYKRIAEVGRTGTIHPRSGSGSKPSEVEVGIGRRAACGGRVGA